MRRIVFGLGLFTFSLAALLVWTWMSTVATSRSNSRSPFSRARLEPVYPADSDLESSTAEDFQTPIRFVDQTEKMGIEFAYSIGHKIEPGLTIVETIGGGVGVLDYDGDGWPDIYFPQGSPLHAKEKGKPVPDQLYRNLAGDRFVNVSHLAGVGDLCFTQGVAAGDFNNDGFIDLYITNFGANRLLRNEGDGVFTDATDEAGAAGNEWSTDGLIADLSGDGLPDIVAVNYASRDADLTKMCPMRGGAMRNCPPWTFPAEPDRFYLNLGDGRFADLTVASGFVDNDGRGFEALALDVDGSGQLSVYIANDTSPNNLFVNQAPQGQRLRFVDRARQAGVAVGPHGYGEGSMGLAADDIDGDGRFDILVTNYMREANAVYLNRGGVFEDAAHATRLEDPSFEKVGWGTQFLDAELDGDPDLVVINGHFRDETHQRNAFRMKPQFFVNQGGRFQQAPPQRIGDFFRQPRLGRGLARLDFNRDGRCDFVVSPLDGSAALLVNQTEPAGHYLAIRLVATQSARDAIGAKATVLLANRTITQQLVAGGGYLSTNENRLLFGLGKESVVKKLSICWPSGKEQYFENVSINADYLVVEGQAELTPMEE